VIFIVVQIDAAGPVKATRKRKYQDDFIKSGFTGIVIDGDARP
jgi:hypothetical protein